MLDGRPIGFGRVRTIKAFGGLSKSPTSTANPEKLDIFPIFPFSEQKEYSHASDKVGSI